MANKVSMLATWKFLFQKAKTTYAERLIRETNQHQSKKIISTYIIQNSGGKCYIHFTAKIHFLLIFLKIYFLRLKNF